MKKLFIALLVLFLSLSLFSCDSIINTNTNSSVTNSSEQSSNNSSSNSESSTSKSSTSQSSTSQSDNMMTKLLAMLNENNMAKGIEFAYDSSSSLEYDVVAKTKKIGFSVTTDKVFNFNYYDSLTGEMLVIDGEKIFIGNMQGGQAFTYNETLVKEAFSNVKEDLSGLTFTLTDFFDVTDTGEGYKIAMNSAMLSFVNEQSDGIVINKLDMLLEMGDDTIYATLSFSIATVDDTTKSMTTEGFIKFKGYIKDYVAPELPETVVTLDITAPLTNILKFHTVLLAAKNTSFDDGMSLRVHLTEGFIGVGQTNLELPLDINVSMNKDADIYALSPNDITMSAVLDLSPNYEHFDSSVVEGVETTNTGVWPLIKLAYEANPTEFVDGLSQNLSNMNLELNTDNLVATLTNDYDLKVLVLLKDSMLYVSAYAVDAAGTNYLITYIETSITDLITPEEPEEPVMYAPILFGEEVEPELDILDIIGSLKITADADNTVIDLEMLNGMLLGMAKQLEEANAGLYDENNPVTTVSSVEKTDITINTTNNVINNIIFHSMYINGVTKKARTLFKINIELLVAVDQETYTTYADILASFKE